MTGIDNDVTIIIDGLEIRVWDDVEITLRAAGFPNSFSLSAAVSDDVARRSFVGRPCRVLLGDDLVISGYVDRQIEAGTATTHALRIVGRGKTQDLVDCSAEWPSGQLINGNALAIAQQLAEPYGISVELADGADAGETVPQTLLNYGETGSEIIQRVARNAGLLAYETATGVLVLGKAGTMRAASGLVYGGNVQAWSCEASMDQRYSAIVCCRQSMDAFQDLAGSDFYHSEPDPNVPRHRQLDIVIETTAADPQAFTIKRAIWEVARRAGQAQVVQATVDSWRDSAGTLWTPNTLVPVSVPGYAAGPLILSEVTFARSDEAGTTAELTLMPASAFAIEPISLVPVNTSEFVELPA